VLIGAVRIGQAALHQGLDSPVSIVVLLRHARVKSNLLGPADYHLGSRNRD
jgi:hypothetical protein